MQVQLDDDDDDDIHKSFLTKMASISYSPTGTLGGIPQQKENPTSILFTIAWARADTFQC